MFAHPLISSARRVGPTLRVSCKFLSPVESSQAAATKPLPGSSLQHPGTGCRFLPTLGSPSPGQVQPPPPGSVLTVAEALGSANWLTCQACQERGWAWPRVQPESQGTSGQGGGVSSVSHLSSHWVVGSGFTSDSLPGISDGFTQAVSAFLSNGQMTALTSLGHQGAETGLGMGLAEPPLHGDCTKGP